MWDCLVWRDKKFYGEQCWSEWETMRPFHCWALLSRQMCHAAPILQILSSRYHLGTLQPGCQQCHISHMDAIVGSLAQLFRAWQTLHTLVCLSNALHNTHCNLHCNVYYAWTFAKRLKTGREVQKNGVCCYSLLFHVVSPILSSLEYL